jgi:hypothetical protein
MAAIDAGRVRCNDVGAIVVGSTEKQYTVTFRLGGREHCECLGFFYHGHCYHVLAANLVAAHTNAYCLYCGTMLSQLNRNAPYICSECGEEWLNIYELASDTVRMQQAQEALHANEGEVQDERHE